MRTSCVCSTKQKPNHFWLEFSFSFVYLLRVVELHHVYKVMSLMCNCYTYPLCLSPAHLKIFKQYNTKPRFYKLAWVCFLSGKSTTMQCVRLAKTTGLSTRNFLARKYPYSHTALLYFSYTK